MNHAIRTERSAFQRIAVILAVVLQIGATFLPQLGLGEPIGDRSDSVRTLLTPAGWAFSVWGPLFALSAAFAIWQALPGQKYNDLLDRIGWLAVGGLAAQGVWAVYTQFANLTIISAIIIVASLVCLLAIVRIMTGLERKMTSGERFFAGVTFGALAAWLTAATIVNISATLTYYGFGGGEGYPVLAAGVVLAGGIIAMLAVGASAGNPWFAVVFCWALWGIYNRGGQENGVIAAACVAAAVLVIGAAVLGLRKRTNREKWLG